MEVLHCHALNVTNMQQNNVRFLLGTCTVSDVISYSSSEAALIGRISVPFLSQLICAVTFTKSKTRRIDIFQLSSTILFQGFSQLAGYS